MSWFSDYLEKEINSYGKNAANVGKAFGDVASFITGTNVNTNDYQNFMLNEISGKADLRAAQTESLLSGVPIAGDLLRGVNGVQQIEDLYNQTGKVAAYPAAQNLGASGVGYGLQSLARKIENGSNDLYQYYAGEPDRWTANMYN